MRSFVVALTLLVTSAAAHADGAFDFHEARRLDDARTLKYAGITVTALGIGSFVATVALWTTAVKRIDDDLSRYGEHPPGSAATGDLIAAAIGTSVAVPVLLGAGVPMWSIGARRERDATVKISAAGVVRF